MGGLDRGAPHTLISVINPLLTRIFDTLSKRRSLVDDDCLLSGFGLGGTEDARLVLNLAAPASCSDALDWGDSPSTGDMAGGIFSRWAILFSDRNHNQLTRKSLAEYCDDGTRALQSMKKEKRQGQ
jgi:hypothetical protein